MPPEAGTLLQPRCSKTQHTTSVRVSQISLIFSTRNSSSWVDGPVCRSVSIFSQSFANSSSAMLSNNRSPLQRSISVNLVKMPWQWEQQRLFWSNFLQLPEGNNRYSRG